MKTNFQLFAAFLALVGAGLIVSRSSAETADVGQLEGKSPSARNPPPALASPNISGPSRPFRQLGVLERKAWLDEVEKLSSVQIFQAMLDAELKDNDRTKELAVQDLVISALRKKPADEELLGVMRTYVLEKGNPAFERQLVVSTLGAAQTRQTLDTLFQLILRLADADLERLAWSGIGNLGAGGVRPIGDLSPVLEQAWHESQDQTQLVYLAKGIAQLGTASGVKLLLESASSEKDDVKRRAAFGALMSINMLNSSAVPPLAEYLAAQPVSSPGSKLVGDALARMPVAAATTALVAWLQNANESVAARTAGYVAQVNTPSQIKAWESALSPGVKFQNEKNREAIRTALDDFHRSHGY